MPVVVFQNRAPIGLGGCRIANGGEWIAPSYNVGSGAQIIHDLRHCWKTNAMRSGLQPLIADAIVGHGDRRKDVKSLYIAISDEDLVREIDRLTFDHGKTEIWGQR